jgi:glycosyltransferase involved in cell wall biosynthesis
VTNRSKLAILLNIVAPYRVPILSSLADHFDTLVLHGGNEPNRQWAVNLPPSLKVRKAFTLQIPLRKKCGVDGVADTSYVHLNLGLIYWLIRFRPGVIISNEMGVRTFIAILYGRLTGVPVWVWWGGTMHSERNIDELRARLRRVVVRHVSRWISYGMTSTEYLESLGVPREQILQIQNCVPHETFQNVPQGPQVWFANRPRPVILTVSQLIQRKGLDKLIEACGRLASRGKQFTLAIVGCGPEKEKLLDLAKANGIEHFVILPNQSQQTLNEILRSADTFVFPTLEDVWGLVVNEALWTGTPVLCSRYAGCAPEIVSEANLFDPMSSKSFDVALMKVFEGGVCPPDLSRLLTWREVASMMHASLEVGVPMR